MFCNIWFNSRIADTLQEIKVYLNLDWYQCYLGVGTCIYVFMCSLSKWCLYLCISHGTCVNNLWESICVSLMYVLFICVHHFMCLSIFVYLCLVFFCFHFFYSKWVLFVIYVCIIVASIHVHIIWGYIIFLFHIPLDYSAHLVSSSKR